MKRLTLLAGAMSVLLVPATEAHAVPAGGAGADTPGTRASVGAASVPVGGTLRFTVTGFPAGEVVYVKIDDGQTCSSSSVHGACVVHQQRLDAHGSATGSIALPADVATGKHWLRFLASQEVVAGGGGVKGYTARTATFAVTAAQQTVDTPPTSDPSPSASRAAAPATAATAPGQVADAAAVPTAGATLHLSTPKPVATVTVTAQPSAVAATSVDPAAQSAAAQSDEGRPPYVGIAGLALLLACAAGLVARRLRHGRA